MADRDHHVLELYKEYRIREQVDRFYKPRSVEYRSAYRESLLIKGVLLALGAVAGLFAAINLAGERALWSVLAAAFPAPSTALIAYDGPFRFDRLAKIYGDVVDSVSVVRQPAGPDVRPGAVSEYVNTVEAIFLREQGQWGQLTGDVELQAPPSSK
jgi:hypothetical protein